MVKCESCKKRTASINLLSCKFCAMSCCISCSAIEKHACKNADQCKQEARLTLSETLMSSKYVSTGNLEKI